MHKSVKCGIILCKMYSDINGYKLYIKESDTAYIVYFIENVW